ncbi:MAG TPA: hypothetical protein VGJ84_13060, partial [Polyangiaceae bacterium]
MRQSLMILALATAVGSTYSCSSTKSGEKVGGTGAGTSTGGVSGGLNLGNGGSGIAAATGSGASPGTGASGNTGGLSGVTGTPGVRLSDGTCSAISSADAGCVGTTYVGEQIPVDIYIMFDVSRSMCSDVTVAPPPAGSPWPADCTTAPCTAGTGSCCDLNPNPGPTDVDYQKITPGSKSRWSAER